MIDKQKMKKPSTKIAVHCHLCLYRTYDVKQLLQHVHKHQRSLLKCGVCSFSTLKRSEFEHHCSTHQNVTHMYRCVHCKFWTPQRSEVMKHGRHKHAHLPPRRPHFCFYKDYPGIVCLQHKNAELATNLPSSELSFGHAESARKWQAMEPRVLLKDILQMDKSEYMRFLWQNKVNILGDQDFVGRNISTDGARLEDSEEEETGKKQWREEEVVVKKEKEDVQMKDNKEEKKTEWGEVKVKEEIVTGE